MISSQKSDFSTRDRPVTTFDVYVHPLSLPSPPFFLLSLSSFSFLHFYFEECCGRIILCKDESHWGPWDDLSGEWTLCVGLSEVLRFSGMSRCPVRHRVWVAGSLDSNFRKLGRKVNPPTSYDLHFYQSHIILLPFFLLPETNRQTNFIRGVTENFK